MNDKPEGYVFIEETQVAKVAIRNDMDAIIAEINTLGRTTIAISDEFLIENSHGIHHLLLNSEDQPFAFIGGSLVISHGFYINSNYYEKNKDDCREKIIRVIKESTGDTLRLDTEANLLTTDVINAITNNANIKVIRLRDIPLTKKLYEDLHVRDDIVISSNTIDPQLEDIFDGSIEENMHRKLVQGNYGYNYGMLTTSKNIKLDKPISELELGYLKRYAKQLKKVEFEENAFPYIRECVDALDNNEIEFCINIDGKKHYNLDSLISLKGFSSNINVSYNYAADISLDRYINTEQKLRKLLEPIQDLELSPLEKYLFAFKTAAQFRKYKENDDNKQRARNLFQLFDDENTDIVCVGFSNILGELCNRLGIKSSTLNLEVDVSHDKPDEEILAEQENMRKALNEIATIANNYGLMNDEEVELQQRSIEELIGKITEESKLSKKQCNEIVYIVQANKSLTKEEIAALVSERIEEIIEELDTITEGHQRNRIYIKDEKYGIDGIYIADPTWCNYLDHDVYVNALMTPHETQSHRRAIYSDSNVLMAAQTYEEFLEIVYLEFRGGTRYTFDHTLQLFKDTYPEFKEWIEHFPAYTTLKQKIGPTIEDYREVFADDAFMEPLFRRIYESSNNVVSGQTIIDAAMNLNLALNPNQKEEDVRETRFALVKDNRHVYDRQFPPIIVEGTKATFIRANEKNKFDLTDGYFVDSDNKLWMDKAAYLESLLEKKEETVVIPDVQQNHPHLVEEYYSQDQSDEVIGSARR